MVYRRRSTVKRRNTRKRGGSPKRQTFGVVPLVGLRGVSSPGVSKRKTLKIQNPLIKQLAYNFEKEKMSLEPAKMSSILSRKQAKSDSIKAKENLRKIKERIEAKRKNPELAKKKRDEKEKAAEKERLQKMKLSSVAFQKNKELFEKKKASKTSTPSNSS
jgi:hypothetical protein